ncbi:unnamed protein product [Prorocentrum cordatum]|uniref:Uncharacterized protein n=1 Tax=Prorocentrum cordatum TaxID=2364126 RepID=A0ABN9TT80_9DINO|nr:unnamed protein product [Polarella glacialis]
MFWKRSGKGFETDAAMATRTLKAAHTLSKGRLRNDLAPSVLDLGFSIKWSNLDAGSSMLGQSGLPGLRGQRLWPVPERQGRHDQGPPQQHEEAAEATPSQAPRATVASRAPRATTATTASRSTVVTRGDHGDLPLRR